MKVLSVYNIFLLACHFNKLSLNQILMH